ncbi:uncharacterized protein LOC132729070 [Ruditapes philippinarum]|uniref:uncharacterized protein LOC132729070 n=1 Tax=Ruditapes philippinarum TaxID=129788 RepID=UPI00295BBEBC|nr:uncharacterized protein LOC132729070 [Ruditapes philippinarum]
MDGTLYVLLFITLVGYTESLECYTCSNVADIAKCNVTISCSAGQSCYHNFTSGHESLGCVDNKKCDSHAAGPSIIGRGLVSRKTSSCFECCSTNHCNSALCSHPDPKACVDDESVDCARLNSILSICNDPRASSLCAKFCGLCMVDGNWTVWSTWSTCDVTCESGHQTKTRTCTDPAPQNGGLDCVGDGIMTKSCKTEQKCPVHGGWSDWSHWGTCSVTCGMGLKRRTRTCSNPTPSLGGNHCFGDRSEIQLCMPAPCANGGWSAWTSWSTCSATCGGGIRSQTRSCTNPPPSPYGQYCVGSNDRVEPCANNYCVNYCSSSPCQHGHCRNTPSGFTCDCDFPYVGTTCDIRAPSDCYEIFTKKLGSKTGVYNITLWRSNVTISVYCDMDTVPPGWTVFQHRFDGSLDFYRNRSEYVNGFGKMDGEFWLGLRYIEEIASQYESVLRLDLTSANDSHVYEVFQNFSLSNTLNFTLHLGNLTVEQVPGSHNGLLYHNGQGFTTYDNDVDAWPVGNCARLNKAGWWYIGCEYANLNGEYGNPPGSVNSLNNGGAGFIYYTWQQYYTLKASKIMFRKQYQ